MNARRAATEADALSGCASVVSPEVRRQVQATIRGVAATDLAIRWAITHRRKIAFIYNGQPRIVQPNDYGFRQVGEAPHSLDREALQVLAWQDLPLVPMRDRWRAFRLGKMSVVHVLDADFPGGDQTPRVEHIRWAELIMRVGNQDHPLPLVDRSRLLGLPATPRRMPVAAP
jgi:hypothetical protein